MKHIAFPSPGVITPTFDPHVDCTMLYTEQLAYYMLHLYNQLNLAGSILTTMETQEEVTPSTFWHTLENLDALPQMSYDLGAIPNEIENIVQEITGIDNFFDDFKRFYEAYAEDLDDSDPGNIKDGIEELLTFAGVREATFFSWLTSAFVAAEGGGIIPALPALALIARYVPAKWLLVAKVALNVIPQLLMSYIKGRLEHPDVNVDIAFDDLIQALNKMFLNAEEEPLLGQIADANDFVIEFIDSNDKRIKVYPTWNVVDVS